MAITNFQQTIWSKSIQEALKTITSLRNHCDFKYEKDSKNAKEVKILGVVRPTIRTYVPGTALTLEAGTDASQLLQINQYKYFNFEVEDIDKAQSVPGLMEALSKEAARGLAEEGDKYVASLGVSRDEIESDEFKEFSSKLNPSLSLKEKYDMYSKFKPKKNENIMGSMKNMATSQVKDYYSPEEISKLTEDDLNDPQVWNAVRNRMTKDYKPY